MKIIAFKNPLYNENDFLHEVNNQDYIHGFMINITTTKDHKIIVFNPNLLTTISLETIQNSDFNELERQPILELKTILDSFHYIKKSVYLKIVPLSLPILTEENYEEIFAKNTEYINDIMSILNLYPSLPLSLYSENKTLVILMQQQNKSFSIGWELSYNDLSYVDTDFYLLLPSMYSPKIIEDLLVRGKKVIYNAISGNNISFLIEKCQKDPITEETFKQIYFLTDYPNILYKIFVNKDMQ